ncbi:ParB/RepB/Spo0J family partition protein [Myxococcus vastator]|uniref:ParB/RepB/Spo0J family partition protein n=1 Tax=Myxococcus vastator TaxID=2709664 RepID=UPI0013D071D0|nr:ParB/RepB/Spo0J family partition protein [Myxococcus vastator]
MANPNKPQTGLAARHDALQPLVMPTTKKDHDAELIDVDLLKRSPHQRINRTPEQVQEMAASIKANGLLTPILCRPDENAPGEYHLIFGHCRHAAYAFLRDAALKEGRADDAQKWARIPAVKRVGLTDAEAATLTAVENLQRNDGTALEQAAQVAMLRDAHGAQAKTEKELARALAEKAGLSEGKVYRLLRLFDAPQPIRKAVDDGWFEHSVALAFMPLWRPLLQWARPKAEKEAGKGRHTELASNDDTGESDVPETETDAAIASALKGASKGVRRSAIKIAKEELAGFVHVAHQKEWSKVRIETEVGARVDRLKGKPPTKPTAEAEGEGGENDDGQEKRGAKALFRDKGTQFILYPQNVTTAGADEKEALIARLEALIRDLKAPGGTGA